MAKCAAYICSHPETKTLEALKSAIGDPSRKNKYKILSVYLYVECKKCPSKKNDKGVQGVPSIGWHPRSEKKHRAAVIVYFSSG